MHFQSFSQWLAGVLSPFRFGKRRCQMCEWKRVVFSWPEKNPLEVFWDLIARLETPFS